MPPTSTGFIHSITSDHSWLQHDGEAMSAPQQWEEEVFAPTNVNDGNGHVYKQSHSLRDLKAAAVYEAIVTARNKYGWSVEPSEPFTLSTRGARKYWGAGWGGRLRWGKIDYKWGNTEAGR